VQRNAQTQHRRARRIGFSLVEIMISVLLLGLLAGIAVPRFMQARTKSRIEEAKTQLEMISTAVLRLAWDTGKWPDGTRRNTYTTTEVWDLNAAGKGILAPGSNFTNWKGPYIRRLPLDPWGMPYFFDPDYLIRGTNFVVVGSFGPNKVGRNLYDADDIYLVLAKTP
jgi:general secretion pathway protein G